MKDSSKVILNYLKEHDGEDFTMYDIAAALGKNWKSINGTLVSFQRHTDADKKPAPIITREEREVKNEDGTHSKVKFIRLTDFGKSFDPEAEEAEKKAKAEAE